MRVLVAITAVCAVACGDNELGGGVPLAQTHDLVIVAHQDDDLLFMQPDVIEAVQRGTGVTNVYVTAGNGTKGTDAADKRYVGTAVIIGFQALIFGVLTRVYGMVSGFLPRKQALERFTQSNTLEKGLVVGILVLLVGLAGSIYSVIEWGHAKFGLLVYPNILRIVIPSAVAIIVGFQIMLAAFFLSVLMINRKYR